MKELDEKSFEKFLSEVEIHKAPDTFTDDFMNRLEARQELSKQGFEYKKFLKYYAIFIASIISATIALTGFGKEQASIEFSLMDFIDSWLSGINLAALEPNTYMTMGLASVFILMLFDFIARNRNKEFGLIS